MNLVIEFIKISKNLTAKSEAKAKREGIVAVSRTCGTEWAIGDLHAQILIVS